MSTPLLRPLERHTVTAPFGVRFWDVAFREFVAAGLRVSAVEVDAPRPLTTFQNGSGAWIVGGLRLRLGPDEDDFRFGDGGAAFWQRWNTPTTTLELRVEDPVGRFLPYRFRAGAPQRGFARKVCGDGPADAMPLYPAPTRGVPSGVAVVRTQLVDVTDPDRRRAASWTLVQALVAGVVVATSYADRDGRVALMFPWPTPVDHSLQSPPGGSGANALVNQRWRVTLRAHYGRLAPADTPDLCAVLAQPAATLLDEPDTPLGDQTLEYGRELVVRSADSGSPPARTSHLLIRP